MNKKNILNVCIVIFLSLLLPFSVFAEEEAPVPMVTKTGCYYYETPDFNDKSEDRKLFYGTEIKATRYNNSFSSFEYNDSTYYISNNAIESPVKYVIWDNVNMYETADSESAVVCELYWYDAVTILSYEKEGFVYCDVAGNQGYIEAEALGYISKMVCTNSSYMYASANSATEKLVKYTPGQEARVQLLGDYWARAEYKGKTGFISAGNLKYPDYIAEGNCYNTSENMYNGAADGTLSEKVKLVAIDDEYGFAYVQTEDGTYYWMDAQSLTSAKEYTTQYVCLSQKNLRAEASSADDIENITLRYMDEVQLGEAVYTTESGSWHEVIYNDRLYYTWVNAGEAAFTDTKSTYTYTGDTEHTQRILDLAREISLEWKTKYVFSASEGEVDENGYHGFDCSGFVTYVHNTILGEYNPLYRISPSVYTMLYETDSIYNKGFEGEFKAKDISPENIKPGNIIFFDLEENDNIADHCGIYLGNNEYAHSTTSFESGVMIAPYGDAAKEKTVGIRSFIPDKIVAADKHLYTIAVSNLYKEKNIESEVLYKYIKYEDAILHFTNSNNWAYATVGGHTGYITLANLGEPKFGLEAPELKITVTSGNPKLEWTKVNGAKGYEVYRKTGYDGDFTRIIKSTTSCSLINSSAEKGVPVYYKVLAFSDNDVSHYSNIVETVPLDTPEIDVALSSGSPKVSWDAVEGATKYEVYSKASGESSYKRLITTTKTYCTNTKAEKGKSISYKIRAINDDGSSKYSNVVSCMPLTTVKISSVTLSSGRPSMKWSAVAGATGYKIYRATSEDGTYKLMKTTTATSYTNTSAVFGTTYYYKIAAINEYGRSAYSTVQKVTAVGAPEVKEKLTKGKPVLTWDAVPEATSYKVYRATSESGKYTLMKTTTATSYTNTNVVYGKTYYYKVKSSNEYGSSAYSDVVKVATLKVPQVSSSIKNYKPRLTWDAVEGATSYKVYRATSKSGTYKLMKTTTSKSYTNTIAESNKTYYYKVAAVNDYGYSAYSQILTVKTPFEAPVIEASLSSSGKPALSWKEVKGATGYKVYRATSKSGVYKVMKTTTNLTYTNTKAVNGKGYYYKVKAVFEDGASVYSNMVYVKAAE